MDHKEVIEKLAEKYDVTVKQVFEVIESQGKVITKALKEGKTIKVPRWGKYVLCTKIREYRGGIRTKEDRIK